MGLPSSVVDALYASISRMCDVPLDAIGPGVRLSELGLDSLSAAEVITDFEISAGLELPVGALRRVAVVETIGELVTVMESSLADPAATA